MTPGQISYLRVDGDQLHCGSMKFRCAVGRGGIRSSKTEGDGATPAGRFPLRRLLYRADRLAAVETLLPAGPLAPADGWCDDPGDPLYNQLVRRPFIGRHEALWRDDDVYDLIVVIGYNDEPAIANRGSAIFMHIARADFAPTEGCVALASADLLTLLRMISPETTIEIFVPTNATPGLESSRT